MQSEEIPVTQCRDSRFGSRYTAVARQDTLHLPMDQVHTLPPLWKTPMRRKMKNKLNSFQQTPNKRNLAPPQLQLP
eukprot:3494551-Ditylum_brightwellii.AAC.1